MRGLSNKCNGFLSGETVYYAVIPMYPPPFTRESEIEGSRQCSVSRIRCQFQLAGSQ